MDDNASLNFVATFAGVFLSFSLGLVTEYLFKRRASNRERKQMYDEIVDEAEFNLKALDVLLDFTKKAKMGGDIPNLIPPLRRDASGYAIATRNVRLLKDRKKQQLIWALDAIYQSHNRFADNTEEIFKTFLLRQDGLMWVQVRLTRLIEHIDESKALITKSVAEFKQEHKTNHSDAHV